MPGARPSCIALLGLVLASAAIGSEEVYRSVDKDGRPVFSDRPSEGSEPVDVRSPNTMQQLAPAAPQTPASAEGDGTEAPIYRMLRIGNLENGGSVTNPAGNVLAEIELAPALLPGHRLQGLLDGEPTGMPSGAAWLFPGTTRGPHSVEVQVLDGSGRLLLSSGAVNITVFRPVPRQKRSGGAP